MTGLLPFKSPKYGTHVALRKNTSILMLLLLAQRVPFVEKIDRIVEHSADEW